MASGKIFCIGFHKTGTKSLGAALRILGYSVCGPIGTRDSDIASKVHQLAFSYTDKFDAFQDNPWPLLYKDLDRSYPGSKFILTIRPMESWIKSAVNHFGTEDTPMRKWIYTVGHPAGNELLYMNRHLSHIVDVLLYFKNRPDDLLVLNITSGEGWEKLCPFLNKPIPLIPFLNVNKGEYRGTPHSLEERHVSGTSSRDNKRTVKITPISNRRL